MAIEQNQTRCKGRTKTGKRCRAAATEGGLCFFHANPKKASQLGRIGGQKNRHVTPDRIDALPPLDTAVAVRNVNARLIDDLHAGRVEPKVASVLGWLLNSQLRAIEVTDLEERVRKLEKRLTKRGKSHDDNDSAPHLNSGDRRNGPLAARHESPSGENKAQEVN